MAMIKGSIRKLPLLGKRFRVRQRATVDIQAPEMTRLQSAMVIYKSEILAIAYEAESWNKETGGDLFGIWTDRPIVYLATMAGPSAVRNNAHFQLDVDYLRELSVELEVDWGLRYLGDWHSHHTLGLTAPSLGDRSRLVRLGSRNGFDRMAELIVCQRSVPPASSDAYPYIYVLPDEAPLGVELVVIEGVSPVREALNARNRRPEQQWDLWQQYPIERVSVNGRVSRHSQRPPSELNMFPVDYAIAHVRNALEASAGQYVELHETSFGFILAVPTDSDPLIGIAFERPWPCRALEVYEIDRSSRKSARLDLNVIADAREPGRVVQLYQAALAAAGATRAE